MTAMQTLSETSLLGFKNNTSENDVVIEIIRDQLLEFLDDAILDIGAGIGDIAYQAFPDKAATLIDRLDFSQHLLASRHKRVKADFFDVVPRHENFSGTVIFSHVLQYLDDRYQDLVLATNKLNPNTILTVTNDNDAFMGVFVKWVLNNIPSSNPEVQLIDFPACCGYREVEKVDFTVSVAEENFRELAKWACYLIDVSSAHYSKEIQGFLRQNLGRPAFEISQSIKIFKRVTY